MPGLGFDVVCSASAAAVVRCSGPPLHDRYFTEIVGVDVSARALQYAARKLHLDRLPAQVAERLVRYETLEAGRMRHRDHRFEWTRAEFAAWADGVGERRGYSVEYRAVGDVDVELGPATQMAVFVEITGPTGTQDAPSPTLPAQPADEGVGDGVEEAK